MLGFPMTESADDVAAMIAQLPTDVATIRQLKDLPRINNMHAMGAHRIIAALSVTAWIYIPEVYASLMLLGIVISMSEGNSDESALSYSGFVVHLWLLPCA